MSDGTDSPPVKGNFLTSTRTKFIALVGALVIASLLGGGLVALWNVNKLSHDASAEIESGLTKANEEYLTRYIDMTAQRATLMFNRTFDQVLGEIGGEHAGFIPHGGQPAEVFEAGLAAVVGRRVRHAEQR